MSVNRTNIARSASPARKCSQSSATRSRNSTKLPATYERPSRATPSKRGWNSWSHFQTAPSAFEALSIRNKFPPPSAPIGRTRSRFNIASTRFIATFSRRALGSRSRTDWLQFRSAGRAATSLDGDLGAAINALSLISRLLIRFSPHAVYRLDQEEHRECDDKEL